MKRICLIYLACLVLLFNCGTHVGNGFRDDEKENSEQAPSDESNGKKDEYIKPSAAEDSIVSGPWKGQLVSLDPLFNHKVSFSEDLVKFVAGGEAIWQEKRDSKFEDILTVGQGTGDQSIVVREKDGASVGHINSAKKFIYTEEYTSTIESVEKNVEFVLPQGTLPGGGEFNGSYLVHLDSTSYYQVSWYLISEDVLEIELIFVDEEVDTTTHDVVAIYHIKKN